MPQVVILGAGIIGLYTTFLLIDRGVNPAEIAIVAEFLPGDQSIHYASPYAGAGFCACVNEPYVKYSRYTYENVARLHAALGSKGTGIGTFVSTEYTDSVPSDHLLDQLRQFLDDFDTVDVPSTVQARHGVRYTAWGFNSPLLIKNLLEWAVGKGVQVSRRKVAHVSDAFAPDTEVVFNCTGTGAIGLGGVEDAKAFATRGQAVVVLAPYIGECRSLDGTEKTYVIKRPDSNTDEVILGGIYQRHNFDPNVYGHDTADILTRTTRLYPELLSHNPSGSRVEDLKILRVVAGARPYREGGVRIEKETVAGKTVVHNYGAGGQGYLCGLGMSSEAVDLWQGTEHTTAVQPRQRWAPKPKESGKVS
ncbi:nucleotide-binding domain-containing protein [Suhomyces tanzawaensis NRRL Y-17324]|uniref:Nucleotide-binding domain-containing protein n=1 Tax=Suhomyces tanzawaensis NRRL Y-17324 TaxID=984487 RepID=A0A1E4SM45_9ASCO|nr:nucleotide-binding domain-containing protein [Suhomyces tanzawaensis NRRL Y-17324]ODV80580.1 nucleotide-binding domain-containing protein [Suhomyces tanzawaensis NRRL Y-17324]